MFIRTEPKLFNEMLCLVVCVFRRFSFTLQCSFAQNRSCSTKCYALWSMCLGDSCLPGNVHSHRTEALQHNVMPCGLCVREIVVYLAMFIRTEPKLFNKMLCHVVCVFRRFLFTWQCSFAQNRISSRKCYALWSVCLGDCRLLGNVHSHGIKALQQNVMPCGLCV